MSMLAGKDLRLIALALILAAQLAVHAHIGERAFFADEEGYLSTGWFASQGMLPHRDFFEVRPPLFIFLVGALLTISKSLLFARLAMALVGMATTVVVFLLANRLFGKNTALLSAAIFALAGPGYGSFMVLPDSSLA
ncbi:MAG: glycosyltransferase family 39 protein, partial [Acidobacteriota bacterium]